MGTFDVLEGLVQDRLERLEPLAETAFRETENPLLCPIDQFVDIALTLVGTIGNL